MKSIGEINIEITKYRQYLQQYLYLEKVAGSLDSIRNHIANLEIILKEKEARFDE